MPTRDQADVRNEPGCEDREEWGAWRTGAYWRALEMSSLQGAVPTVR